MKEIPLTLGKVAWVDDADFDRVSAYKWHAYRGGHTFYAIRNVMLPNGKRGTLSMHALIFGKKRGFEIDHRDGNGLNNRKWGASIKRPASPDAPAKQIFLGLFLLEEDAARAYDAAARRMFGDFAATNFAA